MPSTRVTGRGQPITARAAVQAVVPTGKLKPDGTQSFTNSVWTKANWASVYFDPLGMQTPANPSRLTIKQPGRYMFLLDTRWNPSVATGCTFAIYKNNVVPTGPPADATYAQSLGSMIGVAGIGYQLVAFDNCVVGDYYEVWCFVSGTSTLRADSSFAAYNIAPGYLSSGIPAMTYSTVFPSNPQDGDIWFYPADTSALYTSQWMFRYNAGSASSSKWEFMGGSPQRTYVSATETTTSTSFADLATVGPSYFPPLPGDYWVWAEAQCSNSAASAVHQMAIGAGAFSSANETGYIHLPVAANQSNIRTRWNKQGGKLPTDEIRVRYATNTGTASFLGRSLWSQPIRVG